MKYERFYVESKEGKSNCVIRSFCKLYNSTYGKVSNELLSISKELNCNFNDIEVFETFMKRRDTLKIDYGENIKVKDLKLDDGNYIVFCYDKKDFYHMVTIMDGVIYDKNEDSLELYTISVYKQNALTKKK